MTRYSLKHYFKIQQVLIKFYISASTCPFASEVALTVWDSIHIETDGVRGGLECLALAFKMAACPWCTERAFLLAHIWFGSVGEGYR